MLASSSVIKVVAILVIVLVVAGGLYYITNLKANLAVSEMNNKTLKDGIEQQQQLIEQMQKDVAQIQAINSELTEVATRLLFYKMSKEDYSVLKTYLLFLNCMPEVVKGIKGNDIVSSDISVDMKIADMLRQIK